MFDMSWGEIMVIGGVALVVIGPKDLPKALRTVGQMTSKVRRLAGEFQSQFSEAMREAELQDVKKEMEGLHRDVSSATSGGFNPIQTIRDELKGAVESTPGSAQQASTDWSSLEVSSPSSTNTEWSPLPEPPAVPEPAAASVDAKPQDWSEYGPDQSRASSGPSVDPATMNPDYINPEVQPPLPAGPKGEPKTPPSDGRPV